MAQRSPLSVAQDKGLVYSGFRLEERGLTPVGVPTRAQWLRCLHYLMHLEKHVHFWIGDLLNYGASRWGEMYADMVEQTGYDPGTLRNLKWVAARVDVSQRREQLSFAHHQEVVRLPPVQQEIVLMRAEDEQWTSRLVRQEAYRLTHDLALPEELPPDPGLHHGDCRDILQSLPDESIDLLLTDPPYGLNYESPTRIVPFPHMVNDDGGRAFALLDDALALVARKLKPNGHVYVFSIWKTYPQMAERVAKHFALDKVLVWVKNNWGVGDLEGNYGEQHELVLSAHKGRHLNGRGEGEVLHFERVGTNALRHPTQKPVPLLEYLIGQSSQEGATVLDPFMGSGSSCLAARNSQRRYVGIEIDRQWYELATQRLAHTSED